MASIVPCIHKWCGTYPETTTLPSLTSDIIEVNLIRQEFHRRTYHSPNGIVEISTTYRPSRPLKSISINPYCEECEEGLLRHLTLEHPLSYFSAEQVVHELCELVHQRHHQLVDTKFMHQGGPRHEKVCYTLNYYFERECDREEEINNEGWPNGLVTPAYGPGSERLTKVTVDGGWALYVGPPRLEPSSWLARCL